MMALNTLTTLCGRLIARPNSSGNRATLGPAAEQISHKKEDKYMTKRILFGDAPKAKDFTIPT